MHVRNMWYHLPLQIQGPKTILMQVQFLAVYVPKFMSFRHDVWDPFYAVSQKFPPLNSQTDL